MTATVPADDTRPVPDTDSQGGSEPVVGPGTRTLLLCLASAAGFWMVAPTLGFDLLNVQEIAAPRIPIPHVAFYAVVWGFTALWALGLAPLDRFERALVWAGERERSVRLGLGALASLGSAAFELLVLRGAHLLDDFQVYLVQAAALGQGRLGVPAPPAAQFVRNLFMLPIERDGEVLLSGCYSPGQPTMVLLGNAVGNPALTNFLAVGAIVAWTGRLARELSGPRAGVLAAVVTASSPMLLGIGGTIHSSVAATALLIGGANLAHGATLPRAEGQSSWRVVAFGVVAGLSVLFRPMEGLLLVTLGSLYLLWHAERTAVGIGRVVGMLALGGLPFAILLGLWQHAMTGSYTTHPYELLVPKIGEFYGLGKESGPFLDGMGVTDAVTNASSAWLHLSVWAFGTPVAFVAWRHLGRTELRTHALLLAFVVLHTAAYGAAHFGSVTDFGSYYHLAQLPALAVLVAAGACATGARGEPSRLALGVVFAWLTFVPYQAGRLVEVADGVRAPEELVAKSVEAPAVVVLVTGYQVGAKTTDAVNYPPIPHGPDDDVIWLLSFGPGETDVIRRAYPSRTVYVLGFFPQGVQLQPLPPLPASPR